MIWRSIGKSAYEMEKIIAKVYFLQFIVSFICPVQKQINRTLIGINLYYKGMNGNALRFVKEMEQSGIAAAIRQEPGNLRYQYFQSLDEPETVLLIDSWTDQTAIDAHHASPMMAQLAVLREKYDLHMTVERFISDDLGADIKYIRE